MNCKKGDMAVVVGAIFPENIGAIVSVVDGPHTDDDLMFPYWTCESSVPMRYRSLDTGEEGVANLAFMYDMNLRPIRPPGVVVEKEQEVTA